MLLIIELIKKLFPFDIKKIENKNSRNIPNNVLKR